VKIFILEDDQARISAFKSAIKPEHDVTICKWLKGKDGAFELFKPPYDLILLDHDLGGMQYVESDGVEETGYQFAKWMVALEDKLYPDTAVIVHSYNPTGAANIVALLKADGWKIVIKTPFGVPLLNYLEAL
jgi:N-acetyl-beta-hexosaminidase